MSGGLLLWILVVGCSTITYFLGKARGTFDTLRDMQREIERRLQRESQ